jgi:energy-converting hydrogenase A subunit R
MNYIAFDLEGPLSPQDNAYDLMKLFPDGDKVFEVISRYDDILTLEEKEGYEPGDTLALIVPFLVLHQISEADIARLAARASLTGGAEALVSRLRESGWNVFCITTTYQQYALHITRKLGMHARNVASTLFPLDKIRTSLSEEDTGLLQQTQEEILTVYPPINDEKIKGVLDPFFWERLPTTSMGAMIRGVKPVGGWRKVAALNRFAERHKQPLSRWVVVGDSITDFRMLKTVDEAGGLAISFNANQYALPCSTMSLASTSLNDLFEVLKIWQKGGRPAAEKTVREKGVSQRTDAKRHFHWLSGRADIDEVIGIHREIRRQVREEAGRLG